MPIIVIFLLLRTLPLLWDDTLEANSDDTSISGKVFGF